MGNLIVICWVEIVSTAFIDPYKAAKKEAKLQLQISPGSMPRLTEIVEEVGKVSVELEFFWDQQKRLRARGPVSTQITIICERCLEPMPLSLDVAVEAVIVWSEEQASQLSSELEPWMGLNELIDIHSLLEEELLLALPIMPAHEQENCKGRSSYTTLPKEEIGERRKPFAGLASLIKTTDD